MTQNEKAVWRVLAALDIPNVSSVARANLREARRQFDEQRRDLNEYFSNWWPRLVCGFWLLIMFGNATDSYVLMELGKLGALGFSLGGILVYVGMSTQHTVHKWLDHSDEQGILGVMAGVKDSKISRTAVLMFNINQELVDARHVVFCEWLLKRSGLVFLVSFLLFVFGKTTDAYTLEAVGATFVFLSTLIMAALFLHDESNPGRRL